MKKIIISALAIAAMVGCAKEEAGYPVDDSVVTFSSSIETRVSADGKKWSAEESIGVTMFNLSEDTTPIETIAAKSDNIEYVSTNATEAESVVFKIGTAGEELLYPNTGSVKFYAYYPFQSTMSDETYIYFADVADQSEIVDFMVAEPVISSRTYENQVLNFSHKLSKLTLSITGRENATDISGVTASVIGLSTEGSYDICTGLLTGALSDNTTAIEFVMDNSDAELATATAIIHPESLTADATVTFTLPVEGGSDRTFTIKIPSGDKFEVSKNHIYTVALGNDMADFISGSTIIGWTDSVEDELYSTEN